MRQFTWTALPVLLAATPLTAHAAAIVSVENVFGVNVSYASIGETLLPPGGAWREGIGLAASVIGQQRHETIHGNATLDFSASGGWQGTGGSNVIQAAAWAGPGGHATGTYAWTIALDITNHSGMDLDYLTIATWFSSYAPGGSSPASVERAPHEYARFATGQQGPGIGDGHACDTRDIFANPNDIYDATPPTLACGVGSPDHSQSDFYLADFRAGDTVRVEYTLSLAVEAYAVPEPGTLSLLAAPGMMLLALRRRRGG